MAKPRTIIIDKDTLEKLYLSERLSMAKIAKLFNTDAPIILNRIREYNILPRSISEALRGRAPWNRGGKLSEETIKKLCRISKQRWKNPEFLEKMDTRDKMASERMTGDGNPMKDKDVSEKVRRKLIKLALWMGDKNPMRKPSVVRKIKKILKGHTTTQETKEKISKKLVGRYGGEKNPFFGRHHTDKVKEKSRLRAIRQLASGEFNNRATSIELKIEEELVKRNVFYKKQFPLIKMTVVDFYLPEHKIVIYADGEFWHESKWAEKQGIMVKDRKQNEVLTANGYKVFRFSESNINFSTSRCIDEVANYINSIKI